MLQSPDRDGCRLRRLSADRRVSLLNAANSRSNAMRFALATMSAFTANPSISVQCRSPWTRSIAPLFEPRYLAPIEDPVVFRVAAHQRLSEVWTEGRDVFCGPRRRGFRSTRAGAR